MSGYLASIKEVGFPECLQGRGLERHLERHHVLAGVLQQEVLRGEQLHLPQPEAGQDVEVLVNIEEWHAVCCRATLLCTS